MFRRSIAYVAILSTSIVFAEHLDDHEDKVEAYRLDLIESYSEIIREDIEDHLIDSGLSQLDVDRIIESLAEDITECFMDSLSEYATKQGVTVSELIPDEGEGTMRAEAYWGSAQSESNKSCSLTALSNAGISLD